MNGRVQLRVEMELLSDAVFGSGFSSPGGEDIGVVTDSRGWPYLPGTALKGLLRESMDNWLAWTGQDASTADTLLGVEGWTGDDSRRISATGLFLESPEGEPDDCFTMRTFTQVENGMVKEGTLRSALCIRRGLVFAGTLECGEEDVPLLSSCLAGIKWAGAMRSRGFGHVRFQVSRTEAENLPVSSIPSASCIRFCLRTETPLIITDLSQSRGNSWETRGFIPASALRGMAVSELARREPEWFAENRIRLLSEKTRFLDAYPCSSGTEGIPSLMGFYEDRNEAHFKSILKTGTVQEGDKRAKLGAFCSLEGDTLLSWSARTGGVTRILRNTTSGEEDTRPFQTRCLEPGQTFTGFILLDDPDLAEKLSTVFTDSIWLGADRFEGFGKCTVTAFEAADAPFWISRYGYRDASEINENLYLAVLSPTTALGPEGEPCGLGFRPGPGLPESELLAELLGVDSVQLVSCSTSVAEYGGFNRTWGCREPAVTMYDRGSMFRLKCSQAPQLERIRRAERTGLGIRTAEGFGQILFLRPEVFESLNRKERAAGHQSSGTSSTALVRQKKYAWLLKNADRVRAGGLSKSQLGTVQSFCETAMDSGSTEALYAFLEKNTTERGSRHGARFRRISELVHHVLEQSTGETVTEEDSRDDAEARTVRQNCPDSLQDRLQLLIQLFNLSRREGN